MSRIPRDVKTTIDMASIVSVRVWVSGVAEGNKTTVTGSQVTPATDNTLTVAFGTGSGGTVSLPTGSVRITLGKKYSQDLGWHATWKASGSALRDGSPQTRYEVRQLGCDPVNGTYDMCIVTTLSGALSGTDGPGAEYACIPSDYVNPSSPVGEINFFAVVRDTKRSN